MPGNTNGGQSWFRLPHNWEMDETLIGLPDGAKLLFIKVIAFCDSMGSEGVLTGAQLQTLASRMTRGRQSVERLLSSGCLLVDPPLSPRSQSVVPPLSSGCYSAAPPLPVGSQRVVVANAARWFLVVNPPKTISAGKNTNRAPKKAEDEPRGGAREKTDRQTDREEERTPSGSVRSSSAQAAPRVAGGAAQPAPKDLETPVSAPANGGGTMSRAEAIAFARSEIAKGRKKNPAATGIDTSFTKYDPNRPIEPITSTFMFEEDPE